MSSPSHHALWNPSSNDRSTKRTGLLIVHGSANLSYLSIKMDIQANIFAAHGASNQAGAGIDTYPDMLLQGQDWLDQFAQIWDIGFDAEDAMNTSGATAAYLTYLSRGGALFLMGENANFRSRNDSVCSLVGAAGGGVVTTGSYLINGFVAVAIVPEFLLVNSTSTVTFLAPGEFTAQGTGTAITKTVVQGRPDAAFAVMWKTGSLSNCVRGALVIILDTAFLQTAYLQSDFVHNLIACLNKK